MATLWAMTPTPDDVMSAPPRRAQRSSVPPLVWIGGTCVAVAMVVFVWAVTWPWSWGAGGSEQKYPSPDGTHALVVVSEVDMIDTYYHLEIRRGSGLTERSWAAGCVNGDWDSIEDVRWVSPSVVEIDTSSHNGATHRIEIDPESGRRLTPIPEALRSC